MGCGSSKEAAGPQQQHQPAVPLMQISAPQGGLQMVPTPQRDATGRPVLHAGVDMDAKTLNRALQFMAQYIQSQGQQLQVVAVGGAISTMYLRSRTITHDLDFFGGQGNFRLLRDAAKHARQQSVRPISADWFNNSTALYVSKRLLEELEAMAVRQNAVVFQAPGLRILAAPWEYAAATKIDRCTKPNKRPYDPSDAARYLHEYIQAHGGRPIPVQNFYAWAQRFGCKATEGVLRQIDGIYSQTYGRGCIAF